MFIPDPDLFFLPIPDPDPDFLLIPDPGPRPIPVWDFDGSYDSKKDFTFNISLAHVLVVELERLLHILE
jgi:hypothetical protein